VFKTLDNMISSFRLSIPSEYRDPFRQPAITSLSSPNLRSGAIDVDGFMVHLTVSVAVIVLHGPHLNMTAEVCPSRDRCLRAARAILDSVHSLAATTFDPTLLPKTVNAMWDPATCIFLLFYSAALIDGREEDAALFKSDIEVFISMNRRMGERFPHSYKVKNKLMMELDRVQKHAQKARLAREQQVVPN